MSVSVPFDKEDIASRVKRAVDSIKRNGGVDIELKISDTWCIETSAEDIEAEMTMAVKANSFYLTKSKLKDYLSEYREDLALRIAIIAYVLDEINTTVH